MIKLTEVVSNSAEYDAEKRTVKTTYGLRSMYVNPSFIVSIADNEKFNNIHQRKPVIKDLLPEAKFTKIVVASGIHGTTQYDILGCPAEHLQNIRESLT
jgi:hypothetical protein